MRQRIGLYALWAWLFVALGLALAVLGPALPELRGAFHVSIAASGLLFTVHSAGYFSGVLAAGPLSDAHGRRRVVGAGTFALGVGMLAAALAPSWPAVLGGMFVAGTGFAGVDVGLNAAIGEAVSGAGRRAAALNLLHGAFPMGTLLGPALLALAWQHHLGWRTAFGAAGIGIALSLAAFFVPALPWPKPRLAAGEERPSPGGMFRLLRHPHLRRLAAIEGLYVGVEVGTAGWVATYLIGEFNAPEAAGALATSGFWAGFLVGRPIVALLAHRLGPRRLLPWLLGLPLFAAIVGSLAPTALAAAVCFTAMGLLISGVFPTVMALALEGGGRNTGAAVALVTAAASLGGLVWPWLMGVVAQYAGLRLAMAFGAAPLLLMVALLRGIPTSGRVAVGAASA